MLHFYGNCGNVSKTILWDMNKKYVIGFAIVLAVWWIYENATDAIMSFLVGGQIPGTRTYLSPDTMIDLSQLLGALGIVYIFRKQLARLGRFGERRLRTGLHKVRTAARRQYNNAMAQAENLWYEYAGPRATALAMERAAPIAVQNVEAEATPLPSRLAPTKVQQTKRHIRRSRRTIAKSVRHGSRNVSHGVNVFLDAEIAAVRAGGRLLQRKGPKIGTAIGNGLENLGAGFYTILFGCGRVISHGVRFYAAAFQAIGGWAIRKMLPKEDAEMVAAILRHMGMVATRWARVVIRAK